MHALRRGFTRSVLLCSTVHGARADDATRLRLAREVVDVAHVSDNMRKIMPTMLAQLKPMIMQQGQADSATVDDFVKRVSTRFDKSIDQFTDLAAGIYAKEFSEDDLTNLLAFYKTPTGHDLVAKQSEIAQAMFVAGKEWGQAVAQQVIEEFKKEKAAAAPPKL